MKKQLLTLTAVLAVAGCAGVAKVDPTAFVIDKEPAEDIPKVCKSMYEGSVPKVAITNFTNNSTFDYAKMVEMNVQGRFAGSRSGGAAVGVAPGAAGVVWNEETRKNFQAQAQDIERNINAKLAESVEDVVTNEVVRMGGVKVYTRAEMKKVMEEQKFQMSGLVDDSTLVNMGKLAGVKYIVTGSVNNVSLKWVSLESLKSGLQQHLGIIGSVLAVGAESQEGWHIEADIALRIIDVETGEVVFSNVVNGKEIIGKVSYPSYDALIGAIKKAASKAISDARPELSKWFTIRGYVIQTKTSPDGKTKVALLNIGKKQGVTEDMKFYVYTFQEIEDPITKKRSCDKVKLPVTLVPTDQIQEDKGWFLIEGDQQHMKRVKQGQLVERTELKGQNFFQKLGF